MASEWDTTVKQWLVDPGNCYAGGLASAADCSVYAAAADDDDGWSKLLKDGYKIDVIGEDGEVSGQEDCVEAETIKGAIESGKAPHGVWIGGIKHKVVAFEKEFEYGDNSYDVCLLARPKGGAHLIKTPNGSVVIALYDEEKDQNKGSARVSALAFAEYMHQSGF